MKISSFKYLNKEGFKNLWTKRIMTFTSIGILTACMVLMGCCILIVLNLNAQLKLVEDQNTVVLYIEPHTSYERISGIEDEIIEIGNIKSIRFKSRQEALKELQDNADEKHKHMYDSLDEDTLPDSFIVTVSDIGDNEATVSKLSEISNIESIKDNREFVKKLERIRNIISVIGIVVVAALLIISFFIVYNTINVTIYNRRLEIQIMRCVGATKRFIRYPFIIEGILIGIISTALSLGIVYLVYYAIGAFLRLNSIIPFDNALLILIISFLVIGIFAGVIASAKSVNKYLKKEGSEALDG